MLHQIFNMERSNTFLLACSGGVDSMAIADFYKRGGKNFILGYFNHGTTFANQMQKLVMQWGKNNNIPVDCGNLTRPIKKEESKEEYWRNERYHWLLSHNLPIVTCHHLDDVIETWLFTSMHGAPRIIKPRITMNYGLNNVNVYRPFLTNTKLQLKKWCQNHNVKWFEDESNNNVNFPRNRIRHNIVPEALKINPGLHKVMRKKILEEMNY